MAGFDGLGEDPRRSIVLDRALVFPSAETHMAATCGFASGSSRCGQDLRCAKPSPTSAQTKRIRQLIVQDFFPNQPRARPSVDSDCGGSGSRIMRKELKRPTRPANSGTKSAKRRASCLASVLMLMISSRVALGCPFTVGSPAAYCSRPARRAPTPAPRAVALPT